MEQQSYPYVSYPPVFMVPYPYRRRAVAKESLTEDFRRQLMAVLPPQVSALSDICINFSERQPPEYPDIALLVEGRPDIRFDVEIDEPYTEDGHPIHYLTCGDGYRDQLLTRHGWVVVRLAAIQVRDESQACIAWLLRLLHEFLPSLPVPFQSSASPSPVRRWTRTDALKMAASDPQLQLARKQQLEWHCLAFNKQEGRSIYRAYSVPRTEEMIQKMATFTDAGRYGQDRHIDFEPDEHVYTYDGHERLLPVSSLIAYFFDDFDTLAQARRIFATKGTPVEESLDRWDRIGRMASEAGTFVHLQTENYFQRGFFDTDCPFTFGGKTTTISVARERQHFLAFVRDYQIHPYRQEWPVYDLDLNIAGTIDLICQEEDGTFTIYDWKRSSKVVNAQGQPIVEAYGGRHSCNGIKLPDTAYYHYCIQQNLYRYMLETHYGIRVKAMNLVVLCPDYPTYFVAPVPKMEEVISQVINLCRIRNLGYRLLAR